MIFKFSNLEAAIFGFDLSNLTNERNFLLWGSIERVKLWSWQCQLHVTLPHMPFSVICSCQPVILMLSIGPQYKITNLWSNHMIFGNIHLCIHQISIYVVAFLCTNMYTDNHKVSIYCFQLHKEKKVK